MKQLYRYTALIATVLIMTLTLTSCTDYDEPYYNHTLVGTWQMVSPVGLFYNEFTFYPDGSGNYYVSDQYGEDNYYIEWYVNGSQLTVDFPDQMDTMYFTWSVTGYSLYLYPSTGGNPWVYQLY